MKNASTLWITIIVIVIILIGGYWFYSTRSTDTTYEPGTTTDNTTGTTGGTTATGTTKPTAVTAALASPTSSTTVVISGTVMSGGLPTSYWFEYGPTIDFGSRVGDGTVSASKASNAEAVYLSGLTPGKQYYFRIGAKNAKGVSYGGAYNFIMPTK